MGEDQLDKFIKKQVEQLETPNDHDLLWQKIQAKQKAEEKSKRRFPLWWFFGGASMLLAVGLFFTYSFWNGQQQQGANSEQIITTSPVSEIETGTERERNLTQSDVKNAIDQAVTSGVVTSDKSSSATRMDGPAVDTQSNQPTPTSFLTATPTATTGPTTKATNTPSTTTNEGSVPVDQVDSNTSLAEEEQKTSTTDPVSPPPITRPILENSLFFPTPTREIPPREVPPAKQQQEITKEPINRPYTDSIAAPAVKPLPILEQEIGYDIRAIDRAFVREEAEKDLLSDKNSDPKKSWRFSNGLAFAYGQGLRTLSERASTPADYLPTRARSETPLDAVRINLDVMAEHKSGMYLKSGLEYEQINERFDAYIESDSTQVEPNQILAITFARNGTSTTTSGNGEVSTTYWTRQKIFNHYHSIDIPLLIGYRNTKKEQRLGWFVEGGASINLWFRASGKILSNTNELLLLADEPSLFKSQTGLSLVGAVGVTYQMTDQLSIWANPGIKYRLRSITSEENALDQTYMNLGFNVGMRYFW